MMVTVKVAADRLAVSEDLVRSEIETGKLNAFKIGRLVRIKSEDIDAYLSGNRIIPRPAPANDNARRSKQHAAASNKLRGFLGG